NSGLCLVADQGGFVALTTDVTAATPVWSTPQNIDGTTAINGASCPSTAFCALADGTGAVLVSTNPTAPHPAWTRLDGVNPTTALQTISCLASGLCVAADTGAVFVTQDVLASSPVWTPRAQGTLSGAGALSCVPGLCGVVVAGGRVAYNATGLTHSPI